MKTLLIAIILFCFALPLCVSAMMQGATINLPAGGDLQAAINSANPGDTIVLQADASYVCASDQGCVLPNKAGSGYITIRSSRYAEIPVRDFFSKEPTPDVAKLMARVTTAFAAQPVFSAAPGAHNYKLLGLNLQPANNGNGTRIVELGVSGDAQKTAEQMPHDFVIDKSWLHAAPTQEMQRCLALNSSNNDITNSWFTECHGRGYDSQAIAGWNGGSNSRIINNSLSGAGENFMLGGSPASIPNLTPTGIEFRGNYVWKPLSWYASDPSYAGIQWSVKNLFELKNARQVTASGNVFEGNWTDAQSGRAVQFTPRPSDSGAWAVVEDVQFINNIVRLTGSGVNVLGIDDPPQPQEVRLHKVRIANNVWEIDGPRFGSNGVFATVINGADQVTIENNTAIQTGSILITDYLPSTGFVYRNNISRHNVYGVFGSGKSTGNVTLAYYFPGAVFAGNVIAQEVLGPDSPSNIEAVYPAGNYFPASLASVGFVDFANGNYRLASSSPYKNKGTDGKDPGANIDALIAAQSGGVPTPSPSPTPSVTPTPVPSPSPTPVPSPSPSPSTTPAPTPVSADWKWPPSYADQQKLRELTRQNGWRDCFVLNGRYWCVKP